MTWVVEPACQCYTQFPEGSALRARMSFVQSNVDIAASLLLCGTPGRLSSYP